jgi:hypothetical protein
MISGSRPEMDVGMFQDIFNASSPCVQGSYNARTRIREEFMFYVRRSRDTLREVAGRRGALDVHSHFFLPLGLLLLDAAPMNGTIWSVNSVCKLSLTESLFGDSRARTYGVGATRAA